MSGVVRNPMPKGNGRFKILTYLLYLPAHLVVVLLRYPLAPIAVIFFSTKDKKQLVFMKWLETTDADLGGDSGWIRDHLVGNDKYSMLNRIRWLWRNGGQRFNLDVIGCKKAVLVGNDDGYYFARSVPFHEQLKKTFKNINGFWHYRRMHKLIFNYALEVWLGWHLFTEKPRCKFVFTIRIRSPR